MDLELDPEDKNFPRVLAAKQAMASSIFTASVRVDANSMRQQGGDRLGELIDRVKELVAKR